ncbi:hypothetical protein [Methanimicrococcus blatticola]|uniref:Uncharacterized protein n=1 Tax=Methanimicrococcus blatticola TaxID=91560 RepID=A0A484F7A2_9EURY|nr:hypothetical protein [Methanimicrococcus blatticola]MBZ3935201.1 hypothetical protein [Methanimicrococcus blatticola]MCC2508702.1 hypothetical protein [Methanimicrococcus blatticola]TDQ71262.1 hypothetical protein C7391_0369 [Methanimicrococcus blatticola]
MKKILMIFAVLAVAFLAVAASGCLGSDDKESDKNITAAPAQSVIIYTDGDNVIAQMTVMIMGTHSQSIDKDNVTVNINGTNVDVFVPAVTTSDVNTRDIGYENVTVILGKTKDFKEGTAYTVTVGGKTDAMNKYGFEIVDGTLYSFRAANIDSVTVAADGNNITATAVIAIGGGSNSVDKENITAATGYNTDNEFDIYIPLKIRDGPSTMEMKWGEEKFTIGQLNTMKDGTYTVNVNGYTVLFTIESGKLTIND